jgi:hypothetical protein
LVVCGEWLEEQNCEDIMIQIIIIIVKKLIEY